MSEPDSIQKQLELTRRHKQIFEEQLSAYGGINVPPHIVIGIEEAQKKIEELSGAPTSSPVQAYLRALNLRFDEYLPLASPVDLDFQPGNINPAKAIPSFQQKLLARYRASQEIQPYYAPSPNEKAEKISVEEFLVKNRRVVLLGSAGAGKSTTLRQFALRWLKPETLPEKLQDKTPFFVALNAWNKTLGLEQFLAEQIEEVGGHDLTDKIPNLLKEGKALLLLDGLNELPGGIKRDEKTGKIIDKRVKEIKDLCQIRDLVCLLSCRVKDFSEATNWHDLHVLPLETEQIEKITAAFFLASDSFKKGFMYELYEKNREKRKQKKLLEMVAQPFYLLHVLAYYNEYKNLPDSPALALEYATDAALEKLPSAQAIELKESLAMLAFNMTSAWKVGVNINLLTQWFFKVSENYTKQKPVANLKKQKKVRELLNLAEGIYLTSEADGKIQFRHQLLQEYFSALYLQPRIDSALFVYVIRYFYQFWEVWPLLAGLDNSFVDKLINWLQNSDSKIRFRAVEALAIIEDVRAVEPLILALNDINNKVRSNASVALGIIEDVRAIEPLISAFKDEDRDVCLNASEALGNIVEPAVQLLIQTLNDADNYMRYYATVSLGKIGDVRAVEPLILALNDTDNEVRSQVAEALGKIGDVRAVEPLILALNDTDNEVRYKISKALGEIGDVRAVEPLISLTLRDISGFVRSNATAALGTIGDVRAIDILINALKDMDNFIHSNAAEALGKFGNVRAIDPLILILKDVLWDARANAAEALGKIGDVRAVEALINSLEDDVREVRYQAAEALGKIGDTTALPALEALLYDKVQPYSSIDVTIGDVAEEAIRTIKGKNGL